MGTIRFIDPRKKDGQLKNYKPLGRKWRRIATVLLLLNIIQLGIIVHHNDWHLLAYPYLQQACDYAIEGINYVRRIFTR